MRVQGDRNTLLNKGFTANNPLTIRTSAQKFSSDANAKKRPIYAGLFNTIAAVISLIAPLIGGTIAQHIGYEALFVVAIFMVYSALFVTLRYIPNVSKEKVELVAAD